jgi:hypothetical protein
MWEPIKDIARVEAQRSRITHVKAHLLEEQSYVLSEISSHAGNKFHNAVRHCVDGSVLADIQDDENAQAGCKMAERLNEIVLKELRSNSA